MAPSERENQETYTLAAINTDVPGYSNTFGTKQKCQCKRHCLSKQCHFRFNYYICRVSDVPKV